MPNIKTYNKSEIQEIVIDTIGTRLNRIEASIDKFIRKVIDLEQSRNTK
jgi:hypothetical protein